MPTTGELLNASGKELLDLSTRNRLLAIPLDSSSARRKKLDGCRPSIAVLEFYLHAKISIVSCQGYAVMDIFDGRPGDSIVNFDLMTA